MARPARALLALALGTLLVGSRPARAALATHVATAAEQDNPVELDLDLRWRRFQHRAEITREEFDPATKQTIQATELHYQRWTHVMDLRLALGIWHDLELHGDIPYAIQDEQYWDYATVNGQYVKSTSTLQNNTYDADGQCLNADCTQTRPILVSPGTVYRGGWMDPSIGFAWGILNGERDKKLPDDMFPFKERTATWVIGFDYTMPIIQPMDPTAPDPANPDPSNPLSLGSGAHQFDWWMAMSKRVGVVDPYLRIHYTLAAAAGNAYDNCAIAGNDKNNQVMSSWGQLSCQPGSTDPATGKPWDPQNYWAGKTGLEPPQHGGIQVGTEFIPVDEKGSTRLAIGVQLSAEYVSKGRTYTELSDALRKLTYSDEYFTTAAKLTVDLRFNQWVHWVSFLSLGTETPHYITAETVGVDRFGATPGSPPDGLVTLGTPEVNPNYDFRLDQPGQRLRVTQVSDLVLSTDLACNF